MTDLHSVDWNALAATLGSVDWHVRLMSEKDFWDKLTAVGTPIIAAFAVYYTRSQARTDEQRRRQELFNIRYSYYQKVRKAYLAAANYEGPLDQTDFFDLAEEASFLFGDDVARHIVSIADHKIPAQVSVGGIVDDWFMEPFRKYLELK